jgi:hypothetical protein
MPRLPLVACALLLACGSRTDSSGDSPPPGSPSDPSDPSSPSAPSAQGPGWVVVGREDFEAAAIPSAAFAPDPVPADGPYADAGAYWAPRGIVPPRAFRATAPFGAGGWLALESYTRRDGASIADHAEIVPDPAGGGNRVLRIRSPEHTDATVVRPAAPLPARYRVSLRVGFPSFGDGKPGSANGYDGGETAGPWWPAEKATSQNGFYWLTILDHLPRPHNNTWIHHHRKIVVDSDNHYPPWMEMWNGAAFVPSGELPVMVIALDGSAPSTARSGNAFLSFSNGGWQASGLIRAVDAYVPGRWYAVTIERDGPRYTIALAGTFRYGGERTYTATIDAATECVWHYPVDAAEAVGATGCEDPSALPGVGAEFPRWPAGAAWPDWFMFGDPHVNYYEGEVHYDDVTLEVWR